MLNVCYHDHITACSGIAQTNARTGWQRGKLSLVNFFSLHVWSGNTCDIDVIVVSSTQHLQLWLFHFFLEWFVTLSASNPLHWVPSLEPSLVACSCITCDLHPPYHSDHLRSTYKVYPRRGDHEKTLRCQNPNPCFSQSHEHKAQTINSGICYVGIMRRNPSSLSIKLPEGGAGLAEENEARRQKEKKIGETGLVCIANMRDREDKTNTSFRLAHSLF